MTNPYELEHLVRLFNPPRDDDDSDCDDQEASLSSAANNIDKLDDTKVNPYAKIEPENKEKEITDICDSESFISSEEIEPSSDWKKTPKWSISYRQSVSASDVFLQMGAKTPATASCEDLIVTIDLPGERMQNMDIKVHSEDLEVSSPNFSLKIPLPHPVHPQKGDAKWDKDQEKLIVKLTMEREFDYINF